MRMCKDREMNRRMREGRKKEEREGMKRKRAERSRTMGQEKGPGRAGGGAGRDTAAGLGSE
jgi:hypothetical protein